jgi:hypothetical protein
MVALYDVLTILVHVVPQMPPWHVCPAGQLVGVVPHWPHELQVMYAVVLWHCVLFAVHAGLGGHWHAPPFETLAQICEVTPQPAHAAPPLPHEDVD